MNPGMFERTISNVPVERVTRAVPTIDTNHCYIHDGKGYSIGEYFTINAGTTLDISLYVPPGIYVHYQSTDITTDGGNTVVATMFEGAVTTEGSGTPIIPVNRRRIGTPPTSALSVRQSPTVTATGEAKDKLYYPKTSDNQSRGFNGKSDNNEWLLRQNTTYLWRISNTGTNTAVVVNFRPFWYEGGTITE